MKIDRTRRGFIGGAIGAAALTGVAIAQVGALGKTGDVSPTAGALSADDVAHFAAEVRLFTEFASEFTLDPNVVYFMAAQKGPMPRAGAGAVQGGPRSRRARSIPRLRRALDQDPRDHRALLWHDKDQIAITRNTTDALTTYGFPESADWRALGDAVLLWDKIGRKRIETWHLRLATYFQQRLVSAFGEASVLRPQLDPAMNSGIIAFQSVRDPGAAPRREAQHRFPHAHAARIPVPHLRSRRPAASACHFSRTAIRHCTARSRNTIERL